MEVKIKKCDKKLFIFYLFFKDIKFLILHSYLELNMVMTLYYQVEAVLTTQNPQKQFFLD